MNFHELDNFNLSDTVKYHNRLNRRLWGRDEHLLPDVRDKLLEIAEDFREFLGVDDLKVQDITLSGSNAAYNYTNNSDIDLHLVVDMPADPVYQELFNAKKYQYNNEHNLTIGGADVELYVQPADQPHVSQGIYSVKDGKWIQVPRRKRAQIDDSCVRDKAADLDARIHAAVQSGDAAAISALVDKIKVMRQTGLEQHGEFGCENIVFKVLRDQGCIKLLKDAYLAARDHELSLAEQNREKGRVTYGFSNRVTEDVTITPDGVSASTRMFLSEKGDEDNQAVNDFIQHVVKELGIDPAPEIVIHTDPEWSEGNHSFGRYEPESNTLNVSMPNRHIMDVFRTIAHELVHCDQHQKQGGLPADAGETGSEYENDANARAGIIMRDFAAAHPEYFGQEPLGEGASGYIPKNKREAAMPQYAMALSVDVKQGQTGVEANKMALQTGPNGEPTLLMKNLRNALREFKETGRLVEEQDLFEINMGGKNLRREAAKTGALAGMEFEMIVPNTEGGDDNDEQEPDWDQDEQASSPQDIRDFFYDRDLNSRRDVDRLIDSMMDDYGNWQLEAFGDRWDSDSEQFIYNYIKENVDDDEIRQLLDMESEDPISRNEYLLAADKIASEQLDPYYEDAKNDASDSFYEDDQFEEWLADADLDTMSGIARNYDIQWPHYTSSGSGEGASVQETAESFSQAVGRPARASDSYHAYGQERPGPGKNFYVVEPDGSLEPDDPQDAGLEFVSPPLPIDEIMSDLLKVKKWADLNGCYTNDSTGLHINISVPNYDLDRLDFVKLALLMGDEYVLDQFGRVGNTYARSAMGKVRDHVQKRPYEAKYLLDKMKGHMGKLASKAIHSGSTDKYTSINTKDGHVEFRSPGGDWLGDNFDKIENTMLRFTVALSAAMDPAAYREEYLKKLYKILAPNGEKDPLAVFAKYAAGELPADALKSFVRQAQADRKAKKSGEDIVNGIRWRVSLKPELGGGVVEVTATDPIDAKKQAIRQQPNWRFVDDSALTIERLDEPAAGTSTTGPHPQGRGRPNDPNGRLAIVNKDDPRNYGDRVGSEAPDYLFRFTLADGYSQAQLRSVKAAWAARENVNADDYIIVDTMQFAAPAAPESGSVQWNIVADDGDVVHTFYNRNVQADANQAALAWVQSQSRDVAGRGPFEVVPAAIPGSTQDLQRQRQAADAAANTRRWADYEASQASTPAPVAGVQDIEPDVNVGATQWEVYDRSTDRPVFRMYAADQREAWRKGQEWVANYARMTPDQPIYGIDYSVRQSTEPVTEATGDKRFDAMMGQIQREPAIPDSQMPPTDVKDLYAWAVKNNKPYHKIFAEWANREGYKSVAPALQKAGDLDSDALDYWTPDVWKIWYGPDSEMPQGWSKERVPDELRDYLETVFDAYENIWQDWPTEYRQIGQQGVAEGTQLSPNMSVSPNQDPNSPEEWDYHYKGQQIKSGDKFHPQIKDLHLRQIDPTYDAFRNAFDNPIKPGLAVPEQPPQGDTIIPSRPAPPEKIKGPDGKPLKLKDIMQQDPAILEGNGPGKPVVDAILKVMPVAHEIWFHGSRATGKHRKNSDTDILVIVPDDLVGDQYLGVVRILQKLSLHFDNHDIQPARAGSNIHRVAQEEGQLLWSNQQDVDENTAAGINKMFNNLGDPVFANLQRVALLAMQGRQSEAAGRLQTVIKDADPAVQKKITDAVNSIKPVTINGRVADSSTLDKSKQHNDWIINTFIPWVQSLLSQQSVAEGSDQDIPSVLYHATYKPRLKSIKLKGLGAGGKRNWEDSQRGVVYLALDPNVAESYAETSDMVPEEWLDQIVILKISTAGLDPNKFGIDSNVQDNSGDTVEYHGVIPVSNISLYKQGVAEGQDDNGISFQIQKGKNKFATTLSIGNNSVGVYQYDANTGRSIAEVYPEFKGKGLGKLLVLHAIYTAAKLGLDFQEDESRTSEYDNVLDSLSGSGYIVDDEGYWYVTGEGEQFLKQSLKQGVAENFADGRNPQDKGDSARHGIPKHTTLSQLDKIGNGAGRKAQLARWQANMRRGRAK